MLASGKSDARGVAKVPKRAEGAPGRSPLPAD
jgi:hypothetical protein